MDIFDNTAEFNQRALQHEILKRDEAEIRWKMARDEVHALLSEKSPNLCELIAAEEIAEHCADELQVRRRFVKWCRDWVDSERKAQVALQLEIERFRLQHSATAQRLPREQLLQHRVGAMSSQESRGAA